MGTPVGPKYMLYGYIWETVTRQLEFASPGSSQRPIDEC